MAAQTKQRKGLLVFLGDGEGDHARTDAIADEASRKSRRGQEWIVEVQEELQEETGAKPDEWIVKVQEPQEELQQETEAKPDEVGKEFYDAVRRGKLDKMMKMLDSNNTLLTNRFTTVEGDAIQVAVVAGREDIVSELLERVEPNSLERKNDYGDTTLTLAAAGGKMSIVKKLVEKNSDLVNMKNAQGYLPIVVAALYGHTDIVEYFCLSPLLRKKEEDLITKKKEDQSSSTGKKVQKVLNLGKKTEDLKEESNQANEKHSINYDKLHRNNFKVLGVSINTELCGQEQNYNLRLESEDLKTENEATGQYRISSKDNDFILFKACIAAGAYDIALVFFETRLDQCIEGMKEEKGATLYPLVLADLAKEKGNRLVDWVKDIISSGPFVFEKANAAAAAELLRAIAKKLFHLNDYHAKVAVLLKPMLTAILEGNVDFVEVVTEECPDVLWLEIDGLTLFAHAISKGPEKIYKFAYKRPEMGHLASLIPDREGNTLLHQAAKLSPSPSTQFLGPALQLLIKLQQFKEIGKKVPMCKGMLNTNDKTPDVLFKDEHRKLKNEARLWLKEVATSCSVVATLIVTIMFAAAFTAPGGYREATGVPKNLRSKYVTTYMISDAFSLFFSCTSAMIFLGVHTSLFREEDFLFKLPLALIFGLFTLFMSIATMLVAFGAALVIMLRERFVWISIPLLMIGSIPVSIYAILHVRIFIRVLRLAFRHPTN